MASLLDVFGRLLLEGGGKEFVAQAAKAGGQAGDAAGKNMGGRLSGTLKGVLNVGLKGVGLAAAGAFGIATKGALELENITARYRAETGATAEEAARAGKVINQVAGSNRVSLESVSAAAISVHNDLGAVGEEADALTGKFVRFARATNQDAAGAVGAFDDILDAWGLTAADAGAIMDKLIASHQKYGGSISENQSALAGLAPVLQAANLKIDDGVALLNLAAASGLDASAATTGFTKALGKVRSPQELQQLIAQISAEPDAFKRAGLAADLFGAKAGPKLANALAGKELKDFTVSMEDAAGATDKAADALDSTFSAQLQKRFSEIGAGLRQLGADFGPLVTGAASLASLSGSLGLDKVFGKAFGKLASSGLVKKAAATAGAKIGAILAASSIAGDTFATGLSAMLNKLPGSGAIKAATGNLGKFMGTGLGKAAGVALAAVLIFEVFETYDKIKKQLAEQTAQIDKSVAAQVAAGTTASLQQSKAALEQGLKDINGVWDAGLFTTDSRKNLEAQLAAVEAELAKRAAGMPAVVGGALADGKDEVDAGAATMVSGINDEFDDAGNKIKVEAAKTPLEIADGLRSGRSAVQAAIAQLHDDITNTMTRTKEAAGLAGVLIGKELAAGLKSHDPVVKAQAKATKKLIIDRLVELAKQGGPLGKSAMSKLVTGIKSKDKDVRDASIAAKRAVEEELAKIKAQQAGVAAAQHLATGLQSPAGQDAVYAAVRALANLVNMFLKFLVGGPKAPPKPPSNGSSNPSKPTATGGQRDAGELLMVGERGRELWVPDVPGTMLPNDVTEALASRQGGDTYQYNIPVSVDGLLRAERPSDIARPLRQLAQTGQLVPRRRVTTSRSGRLVKV